jgi:hypothetical protein
MSKGIGFNRNIYLSWLDAVAAFSAESDDRVEIRTRLEPVVGQRISSAVNRRKAIDILINIWVKSAKIDPVLWAEAVARFQATHAVSDRVWLHFGLSLLRYSVFREVAVAIGQLGRYEDSVSPAQVKRRLFSTRGQLGSLEKAVERVMYSLRDWGILLESGRRHAYTPRRHALAASNVGLEAWLLGCALHAHPADELPFIDLIRLPELFPFRFTLGVESLSAHPRFSVLRQSVGWDSVRLARTGTDVGKG